MRYRPDSLVMPLLLVALLTRPFAIEAQKRVAVLDALPPLTDAHVADATCATLTKMGYAVTRLTAQQLADPAQMNAERCDLLILPHAATFPANAQQNVLAYLRARGRLLCLDEPPFTRYAYPTGSGEWQTWDALMETLPTTGRILDMAHTDPQRWTRVASDRSSPSGLQEEDSPYGPALRFDFSRFTDWDNFSPPPFASTPFPSGSDLLVFRAKGDAHTDAIVIEWREQDGSRWIGSVALTPQWKRYVLAPSDFRFWPDSSPSGRGGSDDHFHPERAHRLFIGLANSHAPMPPGPKRFWLADIAAGRRSANTSPTEPPVLEALSPWYKLTTGRNGWQPILRYRAATPSLPPGRLELRGFAPDNPVLPTAPHGWIYRPYSGQYTGAAWGLAKSIRTESENGHGAGPEVADLANVVEDLLRDGYIVHAGPSAFSYRQGESVRFVITLANRSARSQNIQCVVSFPSPDIRPSGKSSRNSEMAWSEPITTNISLAPNAQKTVTLAWKAAPHGEQSKMPWDATIPPGDHAFTVTCKAGNDSVADTISGRFMVLPARPQRGPMVTVHNGEFELGGKHWRPFGINYWPLWVSGQDAAEYLGGKSWLTANQYDPVLVERDLKLAESLGINAVSILYLPPDPVAALNDFLARCRNHHIRVNLFVPGGHPFEQNLQELTKLIREARLPANDTIFAYDVAWEPHLGGHTDRKRLDSVWEHWLLENYGSVAKAERDWGVPAPREDGHVTNPPDNQMTQDGPWRGMVAAYRRFVDDTVNRRYCLTRAAIRSVDPRHLIGARSGYGGNGSLWAEGAMAFDLLAGAKYLDFLSPEGYNVQGDWSTIQAGGGYTVAYARWAGGGKPVFWAEFGQSVYPQTTPAKIAEQGDYYARFFRMLLDCGANGAAGWWWPAGLRIDENSDFGVIRPDGTPRPAATAIREYAPQVAAMLLPQPGARTPLLFDRDADARGYAAVWQRGHEAYATARAQGLFPMVKTKGTGTTTATMPLTAVGNVPADGVNPFKYADADINGVTLLADGRLKVSAGNTGEAAWKAAGPGRVVLLARANGRVAQIVSLRADIPRFGDGMFVLPSLPRASRVSLRLAILGRSEAPLEFGERFEYK